MDIKKKNVAIYNTEKYILQMVENDGIYTLHDNFGSKVIPHKLSQLENDLDFVEKSEIEHVIVNIEDSFNELQKDLEQKIDEKIADSDSLAEKLQQITSEFENKMSSAITDKLGDYNKTTLDDKFDDLEDKIDTVTDTVSDLDKSVNRIDTSISDIEGTLETVETGFTDINDSIKTIVNNITNITAKLDNITEIDSDTVTNRFDTIVD